MSIFANSNSNSKSGHFVRRMVGMSISVGAPAHTPQHIPIPKSTISDESSSGTSTQPSLPQLDITSHMHDILERVYHELRGSHAILPRAKFAEFLKNVQGEARVNLDKAEYSLGDFLYTWVHDYPWEAAGPLSEKDLSKPLTNYFINSSHNTYSSGNQLASVSSPNEYKKVRTPFLNKPHAIC